MCTANMIGSLVFKYLKTIYKFAGKHEKQNKARLQHNLVTASSMKHSLSSIKEEMEYCLKVCIIKPSELSNMLSASCLHIICCYPTY
jgi:hypothetical protein